MKLSGFRRIEVYSRTKFECPDRSRLGSFGEGSGCFTLPLASFRRGVTACQRFVSSRRYSLPTVRFVEALHLAMGSFRRGRRIGVVTSRRYILPWVRFVGGVESVSLRRGPGFVRGTREALHLAMGSFCRGPWVRSGNSRGVTSCHGFVLSGASNWARFVGALHLAMGSFCRGPWVRSWNSRGVTSCHGFVLSGTLGSFGELARRYILPWVRFVGDLGFVRGTREALHLAMGSFCRGPWVRSWNSRGVTSCHGFVLWGPWVRSGNWETVHLAMGSFRHDVTACHAFVSSRASN